MTITIAIWAMVVASRANEKYRKGGIGSGSGSRLTACRLPSALLGGTRVFGLFACQVEPVDQPGHRQPLHEDREGDDNERGENDRAAFGYICRNGQCQR